ncbi:MAG TPA: hypothetical protein VF175_09120 [Lacipirellula sp.]
MYRIFIVSPAKTTGKRAQLLLNENASFDLANRLRTSDDVTLGEAFAFLSGLYFRGKLSYSRHFARPPEGVAGCYVITSDAGLTMCDSTVTLQRLRRFAETPIDPQNAQYCGPLCETAAKLHDRLPARSEVVLLGSIATAKYVDLLHKCFGERLAFPREFVGRGDMSRGGLMLRCVAAGTELEYIKIGAAESRTGKRPPKLAPAPRTKRSSTDR